MLQNAAAHQVKGDDVDVTSTGSTDSDLGYAASVLHKSFTTVTVIVSSL